MGKNSFEHAKRVIAGGVNSPVRAFQAVGGDPVFFVRGRGACLYDANGNEFIDYVGSWGPVIVGHANPYVIDAVVTTAANGLSFGAPTELETALAEKICDLMPSMERIRLVNSGTEAAMSAIRLARGFTGRDKIIKFEGCYHGHADSLLVKAGSGALTLGVPTSPGVPADFARNTIVCTFNDVDSVSTVFDTCGEDIAAVIVEPVAGNMNCIPPQAGFLKALRTLCTGAGSLLLLDEVMTGFRVALGGAQSLYDVRPDLTILGKVIGGGLPVGAFGGREDIMAHLAPDGPVYQAGTLSGNPVAMSAGLATLDCVSKPGFFAGLEENCKRLTAGVTAAALECGVAMTSHTVGGMFGLFFSDLPVVTNFAETMACDQVRFRRFFHGMLERGIYLAPSPFEAGFISSAHTDDHLNRTIDAARETLQSE